MAYKFNPFTGNLDVIPDPGKSGMLPFGGLPGQILIKDGYTDFEVAWSEMSGSFSPFLLMGA